MDAGGALKVSNLETYACDVKPKLKNFLLDIIAARALQASSCLGASEKEGTILPL